MILSGIHSPGCGLREALKQQANKFAIAASDIHQPTRWFNREHIENDLAHQRRVPIAVQGPSGNLLTDGIDDGIRHWSMDMTCWHHANVSK